MTHDPHPQSANSDADARGAREAKIQALILAINQGWYHVPDDALAEAVLEDSAATALLRSAPHNPGAL